MSGVLNEAIWQVGTVGEGRRQERKSLFQGMDFDPIELNPFSAKETINGSFWGQGGRGVTPNKFFRADRLR